MLAQISYNFVILMQIPNYFLAVITQEKANYFKKLIWPHLHFFEIFNDSTLIYSVSKCLTVLLHMWPKSVPLM